MGKSKSSKSSRARFSAYIASKRQNEYINLVLQNEFLKEDNFVVRNALENYQEHVQRMDGDFNLYCEAKNNEQDELEGRISELVEEQEKVLNEKEGLREENEE